MAKPQNVLSPNPTLEPLMEGNDRYVEGIVPDFSADFVCPFSLLRLSHLERQLYTSRVRLQRVPLLDVPSQELLGQWILQVFLDRTTHRSSAVDWIVSLIDKQLHCAPIQVN